MKALTVCQPYAEMIASGEKVIENRTWPFPTSLHGQRIAIHAGKSRSWLMDGDDAKHPQMAFGAIVATARLRGCCRIEDLPLEFRCRDDANGPWCWILEDVERVSNPIQARGAQGLWEWALR